jgi:hypothetical protein
LLEVDIDASSGLLRFDSMGRRRDSSRHIADLNNLKGPLSKRAVDPNRSRIRWFMNGTGLRVAANEPRQNVTARHVAPVTPTKSRTRKAEKAGFGMRSCL